LTSFAASAEKNEYNEAIDQTGSEVSLTVMRVEQIKLNTLVGIKSTKSVFS